MSLEIGTMHMFREPHLEKACPICGSNHNNNWSPQFWGEVHYKTLKCGTCNYKLFIRTEELNSGHY